MRIEYAYVGKKRSRWCAPRGRMMEITEAEKLAKTPAVDQGSNAPFDNTIDEGKVGAVRVPTSGLEYQYL